LYFCFHPSFYFSLINGIWIFSFFEVILLQPQIQKWIE
jgi:hypothetical protein